MGPVNLFVWTNYKNPNFWASTTKPYTICSVKVSLQGAGGV